MMITDKINFKQPKYVLPAILYPLLLISGYLIFDIFDTEPAETGNTLQTTEFLNPELPQARVDNNGGIDGKYEEHGEIIRQNTGLFRRGEHRTQQQ